MSSDERYLRNLKQLAERHAQRERERIAWETLIFIRCGYESSELIQIASPEGTDRFGMETIVMPRSVLPPDHPESLHAQR